MLLLNPFTGQAQLLGMTEAVIGDYTWYESVLDRLNSITLDDIERVRAAYLRPSRCAVRGRPPAGVQWLRQGPGDRRP